MARIAFKTKAKDRYNVDGTLAYRLAMVPVFKRIDCDMPAFRKHPKLGGLANSDLFANVLNRIRRDVFKGRDYLRLDDIPAGVTVDASGFLLEISVEV